MSGFFGFLAVLLTHAPVPIAAQEERALTLREAVAEARAGSPDVGIAEARAVGARERVRVVGAGRWPSVGLEAGVWSSTDPVAAFGGRLRQQRFTDIDCDPDRLNDPDAFTDWQGALALGWTPVDFARDAAVSVARTTAQAARRGADWALRMAGYGAEVRYLEAVGAEHLLRAAEAAERAAEANVELAERRLGEGIGTDADVLQARAALEGTRARRIAAARGVDDARARLGLALGWSADTVPVPTSDLLDGTDDVTLASAGAGRPDLEASEARARAASAAVRQATRSRLPRLEAFARGEAHTADGFEPGGENWTVGVQVRVPLFTGFGIGADTKARRAEAHAAEIEHARALEGARVELAEVRRATDATRRAALAAEAGAEAAVEAARLVRRRYEEGMATTAELLAAQAAAAGHEAERIRARLDHRIAVAGLLLLDDPTLDTDSSEGGER